MFNKIIKEEGIASLYKGANVRVRYYLCQGSCILFFFFYSIGSSLSFSFILSFTILFYLLFFQFFFSLTFLFLYYLHNFLTFPSFFYCQAGFPGRRGHSQTEPYSSFRTNALRIFLGNIFNFFFSFQFKKRLGALLQYYKMECCPYDLSNTYHRKSENLSQIILNMS